jgi:hypothetical protein
VEANTGHAADSRRETAMRARNGGDARALRRVIYVSEASSTLDVHEIPRIATRSRAHNREHAITGALLYTGRCFAGVIEGSPVEVGRLVANLACDPRHARMRVVLDLIDDAGTRWFDDWGMGFLYSPVEVKRIDALLVSADERETAAAWREIFASADTF